MSADVVRLIAIGFAAGIASGFFGIGGGLIIVPMLVYWMGFTQHKATGTSLAILLPPVGLAAVFEYYKTGNVDFKAAIIVAVTVFIGAGISARIANKIPGPYLKFSFGVFIIFVGIYFIFTSAKKLGWI